MMWWPFPRNSIWLMLIISLAGHVVTFSLPGCNKAGNFDIVKNQQPFLTCTGLRAGQNIYWSITDPSNKEIILADCKNCKEGCQGCLLTMEGYNVSRESNFSTTLQFLNHSLVTDGSTIKCSSRSNKTNETCSLFVVPALDLNQERATELPVAAVAGSVVGFVVIVAVAISIAVILKRRKLEEHINEFYQSADDPDLSRHSPPNSPAPLSLANPSVDPQGAGSDGPQNHVYAQVNKEKKTKCDVSEEQPGKPNDAKQHAQEGKTQKHADKGENQGPSSEEQGAVYTECVSDSKIDNSVTNVYMNVDESPPRPTDQDTQAARKDSSLHEPDSNTYYNTETTRHQGDYTNVQPELNEAEGMTKTAESADDYRHLQFSRPEQLEENPNYNHLKDL